MEGKWYIYNNWKEDDLMSFQSSIFGCIIINNWIPSKECILHLNRIGQEYVCAIKLFDPCFREKVKRLKELHCYSIALDCENYGGLHTEEYSEEYSYTSGLNVGCLCAGMDVIAFPEDLGGEKYKGYTEFLNGLQPDVVIMERCYQQTEWWNILWFWLRTKFLTAEYKPRVVIGIWPEDVPFEKRASQERAARKISGDNIMWYSETEGAPER